MANVRNKKPEKPASKAGKKQANKGSFQPNDPATGKRDERINRAGRIPGPGFQKLRDLAYKISTEIAVDRYGKPMMAPDGAPMSIAETILRLMAQDPKRQHLFLEISNGKAADIVQTISQNIDLASLTDEQLTRLGNGEDIVHILLTTPGKG